VVLICIDTRIRHCRSRNCQVLHQWLDVLQRRLYHGLFSISIYLSIYLSHSPCQGLLDDGQIDLVHVVRSCHCCVLLRIPFDLALTSRAGCGHRGMCADHDTPKRASEWSGSSSLHCLFFCNRQEYTGNVCCVVLCCVVLCCVVLCCVVLCSHLGKPTEGSLGGMANNGIFVGRAGSITVQVFFFRSSPVLLSSLLFFAFSFMLTIFSLRIATVSHSTLEVFACTSTNPESCRSVR
jgi:hypothetical protein